MSTKNIYKEAENAILKETDVSGASSAKKPPIQRSASYPSITIMKAYAFAERINEKFSAANDFTRDELAHLIDQHPNGISRDISACVQYGFLDKKGEGKYRITPLFMDIFRPESEKDRKANLIEAFNKPKLFQELILKFDGNVIPEELPNTLIKHHGITESASKDAADTFINSAVEVGVFDRKMLKYTIVKNLTAKTQYAEIIEETIEDGKDPDKDGTQSLLRINSELSNQDSSEVKVPIHLTKSKAACLIYPANISEKDIQLLEHAIKGILLRLSLEQDDEV